jgi:hypothetical protein
MATLPYAVLTMWSKADELRYQCALCQRHCVRVEGDAAAPVAVWHSSV